MHHNDALCTVAHLSQVQLLTLQPQSRQHLSAIITASRVLFTAKKQNKKQPPRYSPYVRGPAGGIPHMFAAIRRRARSRRGADGHSPLGSQFVSNVISYSILHKDDSTTLYIGNFSFSILHRDDSTLQIGNFSM